MSSVELSIQLQTDAIAAVKAAMVLAVVDRPDDTLWWLMDFSHDIVYQNRISGSTLVAIDQQINNADVSSVFASWFPMQDSYFNIDQPITGVSSLKQAIENYYRWRVAGYFNDIMGGTGSQAIIPQYVFPNADYVIGTIGLTAPGTGTYTPVSGPVDITEIGPGILSVKPTVTGSSGALDLTISAVYQSIVPPPGPPAPPSPPSPPASIAVVVGTDLNESSPPVLVGEQAILTCTASTGTVTVASSTNFVVGQWVLLREDLSETPDVAWKTEVAEVVSAASGTLVLGQPRLAGATTAVTPGIRNTFSGSAYIYPLFVDVTAVAISGGSTDDAVTIGFDPDRPQGFVSLTDISYPQ